jgi:hypothetical protein
MTMKFLGRPFAPFLVIILWNLALLTQAARADVNPGDIIDQSNYEKIEGWVPDYIVEWVKAGDLTMKIGTLSFDAKAFWPQEVRDNWQANQGRYKIDENNAIIDAKTGEPARGIKGLPFPEPDTSDPTVPLMLMWNDLFIEYWLQGTYREKIHWISINRGGVEKTLILDQYFTHLDSTKSDLDYAQLTIFRAPFSMAGISTLAVYPLYTPKNGIRYAYTPELRRVKRMSHRVAGADQHFGMDNAPDDSWAGGPKTNIEEGIYRFIGERDALIPYFPADSRKIDWNGRGELDVGYAATGLEMKLGYENPSSQGAAWHVMDVIWVKSRVYVFESESKNPNYGYGPCEGWVEKGTSLSAYKRITDPGGKLWKGAYSPGHAIETPDGKFRLVRDCAWVEVDMRRDHGSVVTGPYRAGTYRKLFAKDVDQKLFTRAGFIKFYK